MKEAIFIFFSLSSPFLRTSSNSTLLHVLLTKPWEHTAALIVKQLWLHLACNYIYFLTYVQKGKHYFGLYRHVLMAGKSSGSLTARKIAYSHLKSFMSWTLAKTLSTQFFAHMLLKSIAFWERGNLLCAVDLHLNNQNTERYNWQGMGMCSQVWKPQWWTVQEWYTNSHGLHALLDVGLAGASVEKRRASRDPL